MGWFRKNLDDAEKAITDGKLNSAMDILVQHNATIYHHNDDLDDLVTWIKEYAKHLKNAIAQLRDKNAKDALEHVENMKRYTQMIEEKSRQLLKREHKFLE